MSSATDIVHERSLPMRSITYLVLAALPLASLAGCGEEATEDVVPIRPVIAQRVGDVSGLVERDFPGRASAEREVNLSFRVSGPLIIRPVDVGDEVKPGEIVARIDPRDFEVLLRNTEAQLASAEAQLAAMREARPEDIRRAEAEVAKAEAAAKLADQDLTRLLNIQADDPGAVAQSALDRAVDQKSAADAMLSNALEGLQIARTGARKEDIEAKEAEIASLAATVDTASDNLGYTYLKAPFGGIVTQTYVENFETVIAKQPIVRLLDASRIEFTIFVPESQITYAPYVQSIAVRFDALPDVEVEAHIKEIGKEASQATRTYPVTLVMDQPPDAEILPGMAGQASVAAELPESASAAGIDVPATAIFSADDIEKSYVWVVDEAEQTLSRREVETGQLTAYGIMVTSGLEPGDLIVTKGVNSLAEGQEVRVIDAEAGSPS